MGAINYGTSEIISIGFNFPRYEYHDNEDKQAEFDYSMGVTQEIIDNYDFSYFKITIEHGYYEGFYINIESQDYLYFDNYTEKQETLKEVTQLNAMLKQLIYNDLVVYHSGWCTGYLSEKESYTELKTAIKEYKSKIKSIPTYKIYSAKIAIA